MGATFPYTSLWSNKVSPNEVEQNKYKEETEVAELTARGPWLGIVRRLPLVHRVLVAILSVLLHDSVDLSLHCFYFVLQFGQSLQLVTVALVD